MKRARFWMVYRDDRFGSAPTAKHWSKAEAENEAERLASQNPEVEFVVLKAVVSVKAAPVFTRNKFDTKPDDYIPF